MRKLSLVAVLAAIAALSAVVATASAARPDFNPVCLGTKIEGGSSGTYAMPFGTETGTITISVQETDMGQTFSFSTDDPSHVVGLVDVKGGTSLNSYTFISDATPNGVTSAENLHASLNPESGKWYGISYLCFGTGLLEDEGGGEE
jgi:hypothetical protein